MSFSPRQYALALPPALTTLKSLIILEKVFKVYKVNKVEEVEQIFGEKIEKKVKKLLKILIEENNLKIFSKIFSEFRKILFENKIAAIGTITTSEAIGTDIKTIEKEVGEFFGMPVILENKIDPTLIGGAIIQVEDWQIDNSFKKKISKLTNQDTKYKSYTKDTKK